MIEPSDEEDHQTWVREKKDKRPSEYPDFNEALQRELNGLVEGLVVHLYAIDKMIAEYREGLRLLQPHGSGRMDIRFWGSKVSGRHPTPFLWKGMPAGYTLPLKKGEKVSKARSLLQRTSRKHSYAPHKIPQTGLLLRLKRKGKFRDTAPKVKRVVRSIERLLQMRATLIESIRRFRISVTLAVNRQHAEIAKMIDDVAVQRPDWLAEFDSRYDELAARRAAHLLMLDAEDKRLASKGYQFGTMPTKKGK